MIWLSVWKDLTRLRRDPWRLGLWIGIPLVLSVLMNSFFGGEQVKPQGRLLVADEDDSFVSNLVRGAFSRNPAVTIVVETVTHEQGRARIDRGDASALLIIPKGFQDAVLNDRPSRIELVTNPAQRIMPRIIEETLAVLVDASFYLQRVAGDQLRGLSVRGGPSDDAVLATNRFGRSLDKYLDPLLVDVETNIAQDKPSASFSELYLPGIFFMTVVMLANGLSQDIWSEKNLGTLRRAAMLPPPLAALLTGRVLFVALVDLAVALVGVPALRWAGVPIANPAAAVAWMVAVGVAFYLVLLLAAVFGRTPQSSNTIANLLVFPLMIVGGCYFPFEAMPAWLARIGQATPVGWAVVRFRGILSGAMGVSGLAVAFAVVVVLGCAVFPLALRRLRRGFIE